MTLIINNIFNLQTAKNIRSNYYMITRCFCTNHPQISDDISHLMNIKIEQKNRDRDSRKKKDNIVKVEFTCIYYLQKEPMEADIILRSVQDFIKDCIPKMQENNFIIFNIQMVSHSTTIKYCSIEHKEPIENFVQSSDKWYADLAKLDNISPVKSELRYIKNPARLVMINIARLSQNISFIDKKNLTNVETLKVTIPETIKITLLANQITMQNITINLNFIKINKVKEPRESFTYLGHYKTFAEFKNEWDLLGKKTNTNENKKSNSILPNSLLIQTKNE